MQRMTYEADHLLLEKKLFWPGFSPGGRPSSVQTANSKPDIDIGIMTVGKVTINSRNAKPATVQLRSVNRAAKCDQSNGKPRQIEEFKS